MTEKVTSNDFRTAEVYENYMKMQESLDDIKSNSVIATDDIFEAFKRTYKPDIDKTKSEFIKLDSGKRMLSLLEPRFILSVGDVITYGAQKYAPGNWKLCEDTSRYKDALLRHIYAYLSGEHTDAETNLEHLAHAACNIMFLQYFENLNKEEIK